MLALGRFPTIDFSERRAFQFQQMRKKCPWCDKELIICFLNVNLLKDFGGESLTGGR
ncbi:hypothetical protein Goari_009921 [Gossypium aridum]|uniref:Uncharacterized protein n=1 Tax=Gossypium aridum TaxID=34290 RepID=A0A7J8XZ60_GOSAI|nr:hypothetical protein [Gossypium aridum]